MKREAAPLTDYEDAALGVLAYEFGFSDRNETEKLIEAKLREKQLGAYDASRIAPLRQFKDTVQEEIHRWGKSKYFTHAHGQFADLRDFDCARMVADYHQQFPGIPRSSIESFVSFAVYLYYLR